MSDLNCIICFEALSSAPLGAVTPCGHCFHQNCFGTWAATSIRGGVRAVTCPMCNGKSINFTNLFLDLQQVQDDDDDDISLSSDEETVEFVNHHEEKDANETEESRESDDPLPGNAQEGDERVNEEESEDTDHPDVVEIAEDDDNSVVEILSDASPPPKRKRAPKPTKPSDMDENASRIRRKAKRLKKQNKFLESQREEFVERERKLLDDFSKTRERLEDLQQEHEAYQENAKGAVLEMAGLKVQVARLTRQLDKAEEDVEEMAARKATAENDLNELKDRYREDVRNATSQAMHEVKLITDRQPLLVQENYELKELVKNLRQQMNSLNAGMRQRAEKEVVQQRQSGQKQAKNIARAYQEAKEEQLRAEEEIRNARKQERAAAAATSSRPSKNYSAQGTRIFNAASKVASKKSSVMDILGPAPKRKDAESSSAAQRRQIEERRDSRDSEETASPSFTSLNVSSKRRKIEPRPLGKIGATKVKKVARKEMNMREYFGRR